MTVRDDCARLDGPRFEFDEEDERYPRSLFDLRHDRPKKLYVIGDPAALEQPSVSVVGARKATPYGIACAELAARGAANMGLAVVSGAAVGCDQAGQREALRLAASVSAVLGSGADVVYPASAKDMLDRVVATGGAVVSLLPWGSPPTRCAFVKRNAIIAALSKALVIAEAGMPSGTFSTAQYASDLGREVMVFPGSVFSPNSTGSNYLIASDPNAMPVWDRNCLEIAYSRIYGRLRASEARNPASRTAATPSEDPREQRLIDALVASPARPTELAEALGLPLGDLLRVAGALEVGGRVGRLPDGRYCLTKHELMGHNMGATRKEAARR